MLCKAQCKFFLSFCDDTCTPTGIIYGYEYMVMNITTRAE